jgi:Flp pilus assembly protein TadD
MAPPDSICIYVTNTGGHRREKIGAELFIWNKNSGANSPTEERSMTNRKWRWIALTTAMVVMALAVARPVRAGEENPAWVSKIVSLQGEVFVKRVGQGDWRPALLNDFFFAGDAVRVAADSRAALVLSNETMLRVDQWTTLVFKGIQEPKSFWMELLEGAAFFFSRKPRSLTVSTPFVNGVVEGTEFLARVERDKTTLMLYEGAVRAENANGALLLAKGQTAVAEAGQAPRLETVVRPRDAVQWALYYPPSLVFRSEDFPIINPGDWRVDAQRSVQALSQGRLADAFIALQGIDASTADARFHIYRAHLRLMVGQVGAALEDIQRALAMAPGNSDALALRAVIAVVQNRKAEALVDGRAAVELAPDSAAARLALSYALQARFDLPAAAAEAEAAAAAEPANALAWARLAELRLCLGDLDAALAAAKRATALPPPLAHIQNVLGFAYLSQIKTEKAQEAFHQAITLDSAAPLPRLGLGLAQIREGHLAEGRAEIEIAAALDPDNALIRSYLGKAYFDEKRGDLDQRQLEMAKTLDPNDPTPWFYDAIRKQTLNRPGEALQDMQQAIELNDNRAVYRSRLMLDDDLAARGAALGRIYSDLSFQELAIHQGHQSLSADPSNHSAHRLLADTYSSRPRHEIARVSELLQSQLLQPLNLTPVQPQLAESNLPILEGTGPSAAGFNEFNPLFVRDRVALQASGVVGENDTLGDDVALSGLHQRFSYSLGQFHYESDGFRVNNDLTQDLYNVFVQAAISPEQSLQVEYRYKETENGDLGMRFNPENYLENMRESREQHIPRIGYHYALTPHQDLLASFVLGSGTYEVDENSISDNGLYVVRDYNEEYDSYNAEIQHIYKHRRFNTVTGAGYYDQQMRGADGNGVSFGSEPVVSYSPIDDDTRHGNAYVYAQAPFWQRLNLTLGVSADSYERGPEEIEQFNPKFGLSWSATPALTLRAAAFRVFTRSLVSSETLEPTTVAGFNQFFDDPAAADSWRYCGGVDYRFSQKVTVGGELTARYLEFPADVAMTETVDEEEAEEMLHRVYIYYLPHPRLSIGSEYLLEDFSNETDEPIFNIPKELRTQQIPLTIGYFHPAGWFAKTRGRYVWQDIESYVDAAGTTAEDNEEFFLLDAAIGYRLPKRHGMLTLIATNLLDKEFRFYDLLLPARRIRSPEMQPERQVMLKMTIAF